MPGNTATIILEARSTGIKRGTDDLKKMQRQAGRTEKSSKNLSKQFARMGKIAAVAGIAIAGMITRSVIKATVEQDHAVAQLNASLVSTGRFTEAASEALKNHASALQQVSIFGDEAIITMQSQLLTFKQLGGDVLPRTTQAVLDLSVKMGQDLRSSAVQLGKALNDPVANLGALGRVGIQFSNEQKALIKTLAETNRLAEAQAIILDELESEFGGAALAARKTLGGAIAVLTNNFGDLLEETSGSQGVTAAINSLAETLAKPEVREGFQTLARGALFFIEAMARIPESIQFVKTAIKDLFDIVDEDTSLQKLREKLESLSEGGGFWDAVLVDTKEFKSEIKTINLLIAELEFPEIVAGGMDEAAAAAQRVADALAAVKTESAGSSEELTELNKLLAAAAATANPLWGELQTLNAEEERLNTLLEAGSIDLAIYTQWLDIAKLKFSDAQSAAQGFGTVLEEIQVIGERMSDAQTGNGVLQSLELELELQGLSNVERQKRIALLQADATATSTLGQQITETIDQLAANDEQIRAMDSFRAASADLFVDIADGSKSAKEAFGDFMDTLRTRILRMIAENLIERLFGGFGSTGGGSAGGGIAGFFAGLFGAPRAHGGRVFPGKLHEVTELGKPELLDVGNKRFLIPPQQGGNVVPITQAAQGGNTFNTTVHLPPTMQRRSATQLANQIDRIQKRAASRNR